MAFWKQWTGSRPSSALIDPPLHEFLPPFEELLTDVTKLRQEIRYMERENVDSSDQQKELAEKEEAGQSSGISARSEPDARAARLPPWDYDARNYKDAGARDSGSGVRTEKARQGPATGNHDSACWTRQRVPRTNAIFWKPKPKQVMAEQGIDVHYKFGTMIEIPRGSVRPPVKLPSMRNSFHSARMT